MQGTTAAIICFVLAATSAIPDRGGRNKQQGNQRFFPGAGVGVPGVGIGGGGIVPGLGVGPGAVGILPQGQAHCRYWCKTPEDQAYCCEYADEPEGPVGTKLADCPDVRPTCPNVPRFGPPIHCSNDFKCVGVDKCCFDRCLGEHVCKPPSIFSIPFHAG